MFLNEHAKAAATWRARQAAVDAHVDADLVLWKSRVEGWGGEGHPAAGQASHRDRVKLFFFFKPVMHRAMAGGE